MSGETEAFTRTVELLPGQQQFLHVEDPEVDLDVAIYQGGFGSGKTWIGCFLGIMLCEMNPGILGLCIAKNYPLLRDTTIRTYKELLALMGFRGGVDYRFWETDGRARIKFFCFGGSEIIFRHVDRPENIRSINAGFVQVEEISTIDEADFKEILGRCRQKGIKRYRIFGHTNPQATRGWIYKYFVEKNSSGPYTMELQDGRSTKIHFRRIIASTVENKFNPPHYVASMSSQFDPEYYKIFVMGLDGDYTQGLVVKGWSVLGNEDDSITYDPKQKIYLTCDFNVDPMCWAFGHRVNGEYHLFDELTRLNTTTEECAEAVVEKYGNHLAGIVITGDASGKARRTTASKKIGTSDYKVIHNVFLNAGVRNFALDVRSQNPPPPDRIKAFNAMVCNNDGVRRVKVNPVTCPKIVYNMHSMKYHPGTSEIYVPTHSQLEASVDLRYLGHMFDAVSYWIERYDPIVLKRAPSFDKRNRPFTAPFRPPIRGQVYAKRAF